MILRKYAVLSYIEKKWGSPRKNNHRILCLYSGMFSLCLLLLSLSVNCNEIIKKPVEIARGGAYQLCKDYAGLMSRVTINPESSCKIRYSFDAEAYEAGFADFKWKEVKKSNVKLILLDYWLSTRRHFKVTYKSDPSLQEKFIKFYTTQKAVWITNVDINFDGEKEQLYRIAISGECSGHRFSYFVHPMYDRRLSVVVGDLFFYQGRAYLQSGRAILELSGGENIIHDKYVCNFKK